MIKYFDAFSGIGGFALAIQRTWPDAECVGFSEVDKYATAIYRKHFESHPYWGDITKIDYEQIPDFDLLCGGSPCQDISVANTGGKGLDGIKSGLFFDWCKILQAKKPKTFLFENVDGILHSNRGWDFARLLREVDEIGYDVEWRVLNSADFGVPQRRMRCFVVGHLRGQSCRAILSQSEEDGNNQKTQENRRQERIQSTSNIDRKLAGTLVTSCFDKLATFIKIQVVNEGNYADRKVYNPDGLSPTLRASVNHVPKIELEKDEVWRRLTPIECERLQSFPDNWTKFGFFNKGELIWNGETTLTKVGQLQPHMVFAKEDDVYQVVESARYNCLGNAVTVNVVEAIMKRMRDIGGLI